MEFTQFLKDWVIPVGSLLLSVWFASSAKKDAERADNLLKQVHSAISGWQDKIMESAKNVLDSTPQIVEGRVKLAKLDAAHILIRSVQDSIRHAAQNPLPGASGHTQTEMLKEMNSQLNKILDSMK